MPNETAAMMPANKQAMQPSGKPPVTDKPPMIDKPPVIDKTPVTDTLPVIDKPPEVDMSSVTDNPPLTDKPPVLINDKPDACVVPRTARFVPSEFNRLDESDLWEAKRLGLLLPDISVSEDLESPEFGIAHQKKGGTKTSGCCADVFNSQKTLQARCKQFAMQRGFQLFVAGSSTRADGGGNVKYRCKKLHGQQFFDPSTPTSTLQCPFYINGLGKGPNWKITQACFLHNHYKFIGWRATPPSKGKKVSASARQAAGLEPATEDEVASKSGDPVVNVLPLQLVEQTELEIMEQPKAKRQRNTTASMKELVRMVTDEVNKYPEASVTMAKLGGKDIRRILLGQGYTVNHVMASRIKRHLREVRTTKVRTSFQKLNAYLKIVADKNEGSIFQVETTESGVFTRALFVSSAAMNAVKHCRRIVSLDHVKHSDELPETPIGKLEEEKSDDDICGVYLKASTKDFNDKVVTFALALVSEENQENWEWFLETLQSTQVADWNQYTVLAGRAFGLQEAIFTVWPQACHHYCMRRIVEDELMVKKKIPMTPNKKQNVFDLARSDSETEYDTLRKAMVCTNEAVVTYLDSLDRKNWVKYAFIEAHQRPTFNELTSDLSMALGSDELLSQYASASHINWFGEDPVASSQPVYTFNQYFLKIADNFHERRQSVKMRPVQQLLPLRDAQLQQVLRDSQRCESIPCANGIYMVRYLGPTRLKIPDSWRHVNLVEWQCTCQDWQDQQFPCLHAIHAAELEQRRIDTLYDTKKNSIENYLECYSSPFVPWPVDASPIPLDTTLQTPLDFYFYQKGLVRQKPGPPPRHRREE